jgi:hypothetical protein
MTTAASQDQVDIRADRQEDPIWDFQREDRKESTRYVQQVAKNQESGIVEG